MFRRVYIQIAMLLILSTALLLVLVNGVVYVVLKKQLTNDTDTLLAAEIPEVSEAVREVSMGNNPAGLFADDQGRNIYITVLEQSHTVLQFTKPAIDVDALRKIHAVNQYMTLTKDQQSYRVYTNTSEFNKKPFQYFIYTNVHEQQETLAHVRDLVLIVGVSGLLVSIVVNFWLAHRALRPARKTWQTMQQSMVDLSHEIQTPLATAGAILASRKVAPETRADLERELGHASDIVQDILYFAKLQVGAIRDVVEPVAVSDVTEETAERFIPLAHRRGLQFHGHAEPGLYVRANPEKWMRLISTLLKNVVDHARPQTEAQWQLLGTRHFVRFSITNIGVTTPFVTLSENNVASGLGLHIAERLVREMHGHLTMTTVDEVVQLTVEVPRLSRPSLPV